MWERAVISGRRRRRLTLIRVALVATVVLVAGCLRRPGRQPGSLTYRFPTKLTVAVGTNLPGTDIRYERLTEDGARVIIKGQSALKRKGDSLDWQGSPAEGVSVDLKLRVAWHTEDDLHLVGTAKIVIENPNPRTMPIASSSDDIEYVGPVAYGVAKEAAIPGSPVTYQGQTAEGARLGGMEGYPYRKTGDSILWEGVLRDDVYARLDLRVLQFDEKGLRVGGMVTLWIES